MSLIAHAERVARSRVEDAKGKSGRGSARKVVILVAATVTKTERDRVNSSGKFTRALGSGPRGRRFKSSRPDQITSLFDGPRFAGPVVYGYFYRDVGG